MSEDMNLKDFMLVKNKNNLKGEKEYQFAQVYSSIKKQPPIYPFS